MWKTRFEVSTSHDNGLIRHRNLSSSSSILHHYYSGSSPTVPRVREDSPSAIVRPSPPSSIPNLEIVTEEDEDIPLTTNEQSSLTSLNIRKQNSHQSLTKHQFVLPTIIESHDENSFVATNTNSNQVKNIDLKTKERTLNTNKNNEMIEYTLDKRINELLQQQKKSQGQNKSTSSSTDDNGAESYIPTTFKDISAFFENKALVTSSNKIHEQKKIIRAKRSLVLNRQIPLNNDDLIIASTTNEESTIFHHQIKRIKTTHRSEFDSMIKSELVINNSSVERSIQFDTMNKISTKKTLLKRWFIPLLFILIILVYFGLFNLTKLSKDSIRLNSPSKVFHQQSNEAMHLMNNNNIIYRYGQFVRSRFFALFDLLLTFLGQLFFRIDKYEYKNNIVYNITSTYEHLYDWFIHRR